VGMERGSGAATGEKAAAGAGSSGPLARKIGRGVEGACARIVFADAGAGRARAAGPDHVAGETIPGAAGYDVTG